MSLIYSMEITVMRILYSQSDHNYDSFSICSSIEIYCVFYICIYDKVYVYICMCMIKCTHTCIYTTDNMCIL